MAKSFAQYNFCRRKGKRKREEADLAARAAQADKIATENDFKSASAGNSSDGGTSGSDTGGKKENTEAKEGAGEEIKHMLTPAQRRFKQKQLQREVGYMYVVSNPLRPREWTKQARHLQQNVYMAFADRFPNS